MSSPVLIVEYLDEATAILSLNRPERRNALSNELMESLCEEMEALGSEPRWRVVILRGEGPAFCAGLDLIEAAETKCAQESAHWVARTYEAIARSPLVTIAAAQGAAYAGGAGLVACCDFAIAADDLRISLPEVSRGLVPALAAIALRRRLRDQELRELALLGQPIDAERARSMGLVHRVVPAQHLVSTAQELAALVCRGAPEAVRQTKRWLDEIGNLSGSEAFGRALELHTRARLSEEAREGMAAFREHRVAAWTGRGVHPNGIAGDQRAS